MIDDDLREALTLLEQLAPEQLPAAASTGAVGTRHANRRRWYLAVTTAAAAVVAVAIGVAVADGSHRPTPNSGATQAPTAAAAAPVRGPVGSLGCPDAVGSPKNTWVPAKPRGVDTAGRLVPAAAPTSITVCAFVGPNSPLTASGAVQLAGELSATDTFLSTVGPTVFGGCFSDLEPGDGDQFLVRFAYPAGAVWLSVAGNHCGGATNGQFTTAAVLGRLVSSWFATGRATPPVPESCGTTGNGAGRIGQDTAMVPGNPIAVEICQGNGSRTGTTVTGRDLAQLVHDLNAQSAGPVVQAGSCTPTGKSGSVRPYGLIFRYAEGSTTDVLAIANCTPSIQNGNLQIRSAPAIIALVEQLYGSSK